MVFRPTLNVVCRTIDEIEELYMDAIDAWETYCVRNGISETVRYDGTERLREEMTRECDRMWAEPERMQWWLLVQQ